MIFFFKFLINPVIRILDYCVRLVLKIFGCRKNVYKTRYFRKNLNAEEYYRRKWKQPYA
jgi:hypothetical protein